MTRRYMDFAPKKTSRTTGASGGVVRKKTAAGVTVKRTTGLRAARPTTVKKPTVARAAAVRSTGVAKTTTTKKPAVRVAQNTAPMGRAKLAHTGVKLGEIEDVNPKFVMTDVPKRALGDTGVTAVSAKAQKVGARAKTVKKADTTSRMKLANEKKKTYTVPKAPFINQDKVAKRPLSKNVYKKQIDALEKVPPKGVISDKTVTIIAKPEKDSKVGVIVTIVLTIILGAVAGTVAFLLLPK